MEQDFKAAILVLAAGASRRMQSIKQLLPYNGATLLENALKMAKMSKNAEVFCVLGANRREIQQKVDFKDVQVIENKDWSVGLGKSIAVGVKAIEKKQQFDAILIILADQPFITSAYLDKMITKFAQYRSKIIATSYDQKPGVPALFPQHYFSELMKLTEDHGAKNILKNTKNIILLEAKNTFDVDKPEDYEALIRS